MISAAWFKSVVQNIGSRERHRAEDAAKRFAGDKAGFDAWLVGFNAEHSTYCINVLLSPAKSIAPEAQELSVAMGLVVERYITQRGAELSEQFNNATFGGESRFHSWLAEQAAHAARIAAEWIHSNPSKEAETCNDMN